MRKINIIILGKSGFIGSNLFNFFSQNRELYRVYGFARTSSYEQNHFEYNSEDINRLNNIIYNDTENILINCCYDADNLSKNRTFINFIISLSKRIRISAIINLSSISLYEGYTSLSIEKKVKKSKPKSIYGKIKLIVDNKIRENFKDIPIHILRLPNIIGNGGSWNNYFVEASDCDVIFMPAKGLNKTLFLDVKNFCTSLESYIQSEEIKLRYNCINLIEHSINVTWQDYFLKYDFKGKFESTNKRTFTNSFVKNILLMMLSSNFFVKLLFFSNWLNKVLYSKLVKNNSNKEKKKILFSENTTRLIQNLDLNKHE